MARISGFIVFAVIMVVATAQRNRPFPTTKQPTNVESTTPATTSTTAKDWGYPVAGFRPGKAFELPTEDKNDNEPNPKYGPPAREGKAVTPAPTQPPSKYGPPARDARARTPAPTTTTTTTTTTTAKPSQSYGPPARDGRAFTPPPTADPLPTYLPPAPADKYGPPEEATTTIAPEESEAEPTTPKVPTPRSLEGNGFYFIRLPNGWISRTGLLSFAPLEVQNTTVPEVNLDDVETIEAATSSPPASRNVPASQPGGPGVTFTSVAPLSPIVPFTPADPLNPAVQVQPVVQTQRSIQFWPPPRQAEKLVTVQRQVVPTTTQYLQEIVQPNSVYETVEPVYYYQPQAYSYSSQYRSW